MLSFMRIEAALERIVLFPLSRRSDSEPSSPSGSASDHLAGVSLGSSLDSCGPGADTLRKLEAFDIGVCKCYDPNEQAVLLRIIKTVGVGFFNTRIRALAKSIESIELTNAASMRRRVNS